MQRNKSTHNNGIKKLVPKNPWNLVWIVTLAAVILTTFINYLQGFIWYGHISHDLLIIGMIDAIVVALILTPIAIRMGLVEQQRVEKELNALAYSDDLTKLHNRRSFFLLADQVLKMASRSKSGMYLMYIDLDYFKKINDTYGHAEGDRMLISFAQLLRENYRESDIIARMGGDEFVLVPVGTPKDGIDVIKNRFNRLIADFNKTHDNPWTFSATIGLALYDPQEPCSLDELLGRADSEMYLQREARRAAETRPITSHSYG